MDARREQLLVLLNRRRRHLRLALVCLTMFLVGGITAVILEPRILIGGVSPGTDGIFPPNVLIRPSSKAVVPGPLNLGERVSLDPRELQANVLRWASVSENERRVLLDRYWRLTEMDPADRERIFGQYGAFRELPEKRQEFLRARAQKLRAFMQSLSAQDLALLESMSDTERAQRLLELWQARHKTW